MTSTTFSWSGDALTDLELQKTYSFSEESVRTALYHPFFKQFAYFNRDMVEMVYQIPLLFPTSETPNRVICISGIGVMKEFSALITDIIPDVQIIGNAQCFPLYYYETAGYRSSSVRSVLPIAGADDPGQTPEPRYVRRDGISDFILKEAQSKYADQTITKEDIFYYVYGFLHSREYRATFSADLKKILARIPLVKRKEDFLTFSHCGRELAELHLHYEDASPYPGVEVTGAETGSFQVQKMQFKTRGDKSRIQYNAFIAISNIPAKAYEYVVNGKSAIEWINPRYILDLLLSVITVSMKTMEIVESLPAFEC